MTAYVDDARIRYRGMIMCHLVADTVAALHEMARAIGVHRRHYHRSHYNVSQVKRQMALRLGAVEITQRQAAKIRRTLAAAATAEVIELSTDRIGINAAGRSWDGGSASVVILPVVRIPR